MAAGRAHLLTAATVAAAITVAAGCGGQSASENQKAVVDAAGVTGRVRSYRVSTNTLMKVPRRRQVRITGEGAFEPKARAGKLTLDMSELSVLLGRPIGTAQLILDGRDVYMRIPYLKAIQPSLKPWLKVDLVEAGRSRGLDFSSFLQFGQGGDPTQTLYYLRAVTDVEKVGEEKVRGAATTHYRGTILLARVAKKVPKRARKQVRDSVARLIALMRSNKIPVDVWIDDSNRLRRFSYRETLRAGGNPTKIRNSIEFFDFGTKVIAPPPPASDVTDLTPSLTKPKR
jgi:hypothetical protein